METVVGVDLEQVIIEGHAVILCVRSDLADEADSRRRTFVAYSIVRQEAEALLTTTDIFAFAFPHTDTVGNPFEACVFVGEGDTLCVRNLTDELGGHDGLDDIHIVAELTQTLHVVDDVVVEHDVGLVTVDDDPLAFVITANYGDTVRVRVGSDDEVSAEFGTEFHTEGHSFSVLRVRGNDSREITIDHHLLGHYVDVLESP